MYRHFLRVKTFIHGFPPPLRNLFEKSQVLHLDFATLAGNHGKETKARWFMWKKQRGWRNKSVNWFSTFIFMGISTYFYNVVIHLHPFAKNQQDIPVKWLLHFKMLMFSFMKPGPNVCGNTGGGIFIVSNGTALTTYIVWDWRVSIQI